jgi:hypothetical protein
MNGKAYPYEKDGVVWGFGYGQSWPPGFDAQIVVPQFDQFRGLPKPERPYLAAGTVVPVESDEGDHLFVSFDEPGSEVLAVVPIHKSHVKPIATGLLEA